MHQPPIKQEQTSPLHSHNHHLRLFLHETLAAADLEQKLAHSRKKIDFKALVDALEDIKLGLGEGSAADTPAVRGVCAGGAFPLGSKAGGDGDRKARVSETHGGEMGKEGAVNLSSGNLNEAFEPCPKCGCKVKNHHSRNGGVALSGEDEEIEGGGLKPFTKPSHENGTVRFSQKFKYYKKKEDISKGSVQLLKKNPANNDGGTKLSAKKYQHYRHGQVSQPIKYGHEAEGGNRGVNFFGQKLDKGITRSEGYEYDVLSQDEEEGGGVSLYESCEGGRDQPQFEDQDSDDGGVRLPEARDIECGGVKLFNEPRTEDEDADGYQDSSESSQETDDDDDDDDGDQHESEMNPPQQHRSNTLPGPEGSIFFKNDHAKPSPSYVKLLAHFLL
ncbi:hypothetical protein HOY80DRAFT_1038671 [Tuber brumale]|nr:hypothetical protein HOY80DRAFT_1038671 [Tuber brumale]